MSERAAEPAARTHVVELVQRQPTGAAKVWFTARNAVAGLVDGWVPAPRVADVVVRARTSSTPLMSIPVDTEDAAGVHAKVQDDLERLDLEQFRREWGL